MNQAAQESLSALVLAPLQRALGRLDAAEAHFDQAVEAARVGLIREVAFKHVPPEKQEHWVKLVEAAGYTMAGLKAEGAALRDRRIEELLDASEGFEEAEKIQRSAMLKARELRSELPPQAKRRQHVEQLASQAHRRMKPLAAARQQALELVGVPYYQDRAKLWHAERRLRDELSDAVWQLDRIAGALPGAREAQVITSLRAKVTALKPKVEKLQAKHAKAQKRLAAIEGQIVEAQEKALAAARKRWAKRAKSEG